MDGTIEGSPRAARSALPKSGNSHHASGKRRGFFERLFAVRDSHDHNGHAVNSASVENPVGLGALNPFHSSNPPVEDVAVPKAEIIAVPLGIELTELIETFRESGRTRLPVYRDSLDTPVGFAHLKDLALEHGFNGQGTDFALKQEMLRELLFVPGSMRVATLLEWMQAKRIHMALIIDEYGGTDGLVTIEDLVEVIFGDIADEHDESDDELISEDPDGGFLCHAKLPLAELKSRLGQSLAEIKGIDDEVDSLGGLVFVLAGRVPVVGEVINYKDAQLEFEIVAAEPQKIRLVRVRKSPTANH